jgi:hypothetical protein
MKTLSAVCLVLLLAVLDPICATGKQAPNSQTAGPATKPTQSEKAKPDAKKSGDQSKKTKKVWTDDNLGELKGTVSVVGKPKSGRADTSYDDSGGDSEDGPESNKPSVAQQLRSQLASLQAQLDDTDQKIAQLKNIQSGATSGDSQMKLHHGYNMDPLPDQIKKLEDRKNQIQAQMDAIFEQARKNGIEPGELR